MSPFENLQTFGCPDFVSCSALPSFVFCSTLACSALPDIVDELRQSLSGKFRRGLLLVREKGASVCLTCWPINEFGFCLHYSAFLNSLALRCGWNLSNNPLTPVHVALPSLLIISFML